MGSRTSRAHPAVLLPAVLLPAVLLAATALLAGCAGSTTDKGATRPAVGTSPSPSGPGEDPFEVPRAVDRGAWCGRVDEGTVVGLVGARITRRATLRPPADGPAIELFRCDFGTERVGDDAARGLALSFVPRSAGTAGDSRRAGEADPRLRPADCDFEDLPGVDTERGYAETCAGSPGAADTGDGYVAAGTAVRVDVGPGHLYCQEYSPPTDPSGVEPLDVVSACEELFGQVSR